MEVEVRYEDIFGISCHVDHLSGKVGISTIYNLFTILFMREWHIHSPWSRPNPSWTTLRSVLCNTSMTSCSCFSSYNFTPYINTLLRTKRQLFSLSFSLFDMVCCEICFEYVCAYNSGNITTLSTVCVREHLSYLIVAYLIYLKHSFIYEHPEWPIMLSIYIRVCEDCFKAEVNTD